MKRALISVYDKTGIVGFARELGKLGFEIIATGGTLETLKEGGIQFVKHVSEVTDFPEILEGRVKTEHPKLIGGILALRDKKEHVKHLARFGIEHIDMVVCNLYPFERVTDQGADLKTAQENIDIGGPTGSGDKPPNPPNRRFVVPKLAPRHNPGVESVRWWIKVD